MWRKGQSANTEGGSFCYYLRKVLQLLKKLDVEKYVENVDNSL